MINTLKILPMIVLSILLASGLKQCQQNICDSDPMMCDQPLERIMQQEYIDIATAQALAISDSFYNLGFAQGLALGIFIAFMVYIKVSG